MLPRAGLAADSDAGVRAAAHLLRPAVFHRPGPVAKRAIVSLLDATRTVDGAFKYQRHCADCWGEADHLGNPQSEAHSEHGLSGQ
jgi:hypothetical protein